jgi:cytochrome d ubiquinol oxidase subunit I
VKLAAMEGHFETRSCAPLHIGGIPDREDRVTRFAIEIPCGLSFLAFGDFDAEVKGLNAFPEDEWPPLVVTHLAFQLMVMVGFTLAGTALLAGFLAWRRRALPTGRRFLTWLVLVGPLGFVAVEAGWVVTEVGRQPWVVKGLLKTADAVTPMPGLWAPFLVFTLLYVVLGVTAIVLLRRHVFQAPTGPAAEAGTDGTPSAGGEG